LFSVIQTENNHRHKSSRSKIYSGFLFYLEFAKQVNLPVEAAG